MNFLNPFMLFGLAAAAVPVIMHLLSRRRARTVAFPSIELLKRMKTERIRRLRLKQLLILLLRTLFIVFVVLAFARPALRSSFRRNARAAAVILIDASASMRYIHNGETLFAGAVNAARDILGLFGDSDRAAVILGLDEPLVLEPGMTPSGRRLGEALDDAEPGFGAGSSLTAFRRADAMLASTGMTNRELYYITDGASDALPDSLAHDPRRTVYMVFAGPGDREGGVITDIRLADRFVTPGDSVIIAATMRALSGNGGTSVEFFVDGERKGRTAVVPASGEDTTAMFTFVPSRPGLYSIAARIDDDRFPPGGERRMVLNVPRPPAVVIVGDEPGDMYHPLLALSPDDVHPMFDITARTVEDLTPDDIARADVVVLTSVRSLPQALYRPLLDAVVENGAGLAVFLPRTLDEALYGDGIFRDMFPAEIGKRVEFGTDTAGGFTVMDRFDTDHPILGNMTGGGGFQLPRVTAYHRLRPQGAATSFVRFSDGSMAAGEAPCGRGRVAVFAMSATTGDGDFPLTGIFAPMVVRTVQYLSRTFLTGSAYVSGEQVRETTGNVQPSQQVSIRREGQAARSVEASFTGNGAVIDGLRAGEPGFYSVLVDGVERARFSVDVPRQELLFTRAGNERIADAFKGERVRVAGASSSLAEFIARDRYGTELYGLFIVLALLAAAIEMAIARRL